MSGEKRCLITNSIITSLAKKFNGETEESIKGLIALWQKNNNKDLDEYPSAKELNSFKIQLREKEKSADTNASTNTSDNVKEVDTLKDEVFKVKRATSIEAQAKVDTTFDPKTRRDRVSLIARFFSNIIDTELETTSTSLKARIEAALSKNDNITANELRLDLKELNRFNIIKSKTPNKMFESIRDIFNNYVLDSEENRIKSEFDILSSKKGADKYSTEQLYEAAKKKALYKTSEYNKILDNFEALVEEACTILISTESIRINPDYAAPKESDVNSEDPDGERASDTNPDVMGKEESYKDGWMSNYREISSHNSLSQEVRKFIRQIPQLNYKGVVDRDDLGNLRFLDADYVHAVLIDKLNDMITSEDLIPLLNQLVNTKPWIKQVIIKLQEDGKLFSQFYQDFRKDFVPYWIQKKKIQPDGSYKVETVSVNSPEGVYYLLDEWRDNIDNANILDDDSVYDKNRDINKENAQKGLNWTKALNNKFNNLSTEESLELLKSENVWKTINKLLNMIGINANQSVLMTALTNIKSTESIKIVDPILQLLPQLDIIFKGIVDGKIKSEISEDGSEVRGDMLNTFGSAYNSIAAMLAEVTEDAIESSVRENEKSYYSHTTPNYLGKLIKQLRNVLNDEEKFDQFIKNEFKQYEWFYKDGWRNDWLEQLVNNPEMRKGLKHKVLLNYDKVEYSKWDDLDYTMVLLNEYFSNPDNSKSNTQWAYYHVPILSDSPSAEFIRFRKYDNTSILGEDGKYKTFDDILSDKFIDIVNQEIDRIAIVNQRMIEYQNGSTDIELLANYDIKLNKDGTISSKGGSEFKFLPKLNDIRYENGASFLDEFQRIQKEGTGEELRLFIKDTIKDIIDEEFEETYKEWHKIGLFDELPNGNYANLWSLGITVGQSSYNRNLVVALSNAKQALGNSWTEDMSNLLNAVNKNDALNDKQTNTILDEIKSLLDSKVNTKELEVKRAEGIKRGLVLRNNAKNKLREYFWNSKFATSQIIELTTTDLAFYKDIEDFQKRFKEVHAPALRMNTNSKYGRKEERTIYLSDEIITSSVYDDIKAVLDTKVANNELSKYDRDIILSKYKEVNVADAQAYRSLSSYRAILDMSGQWTEEMQNAFDRFQNNTWDISDFNIIWQTKKPYVYTQVNNDSGLDGHTGIKTPVQHKNSEFLLLAMHSLIAGPLNKSGKLKAINKFMEDNNIDVVQFESTTKVGKQGVIDLNNVTSEEDTLKLLKAKTGIGSLNGENSNVVHKVSYEDYGIQVETPEHVIDAVQLIGTQIRKLVTADMSDDIVIDVNGKKMTKKEWLDLYNAVNTENILQAFIDVNEIFKDPKEVEKVLLEEMRGNQRYGIEMIRACTLNENNEFNIPIYDPVVSQKVQSLLNSIIKSRITKQKIRGGALIQVSNYGLTDSLSIVFKDKEGNLLNKEVYLKKNRNSTQKDYEDYIKEARTKGDLSIAYLECYMPAYSKEFYAPLMKEGSHELDITKLPDNLRKLVGYRVPTEDKYSMAPLYIKGFLPQINGSAIMLPSEITTLSGSDFDVDKLYVMLPEFSVDTYDYKKAKEDFSRDQRFLNKLSSLFNDGNMLEDLANAPIEFQEWFEGVKDNYILDTPRIRKVKYNFNKSPKDNSLKARNNLIIDMMYGVLTNSDTAIKMLNPGGFDYQKKAARIITLLESSRESDLRKLLNIKNDESTINTLISYDLDKLDKLAKKFKKKLDPLNPRTQVILHQQNMTGAALIGIYANHNANHALIQNINSSEELTLDEKNGSFILNGKRLTSLQSIKNENNEYISRNTAGFLAASVDNVKDPVLAALNQNTFTADATMLLIRLGYTPIEVGLLLSQPIIKEITSTYFRESRNGKSADSIIDSIIKSYKSKTDIMGEVSYNDYKSNSFKIEDLADNIIIAKEMSELSDRSQTSDFRKVEFYKNQVAAGILFKRIMNSADALGKLVQATRADTGNGAAGPTIADTMIKLQKVNDFIEKVVFNEKSPLKGADIIKISDLNNLSEDEIRNYLLESPLPYLQAFYSLGMEQTKQMFSKYFPHFSTPFMEVIDGKYNSEGQEEVKGLRNYTKYGKLDVKTINNIYNDLMAYIMSKTELFGQGSFIKEGGVEKLITSEDKRKYFINNFVDYFNETLNNNPDIAELEFIKRLKVSKANKNNPVDTLVFRNVGNLTYTLKERYMRDWASLLYMDNPKAQDLAINLFVYSYYRNGFAFGPNTFIHLAPTVVRLAIPNYVSTLRSLLTSEDDYSQFINQYIYNHLDNRKFVPEISSESSVKFLEDGEVLDTISVSIDKDSSSDDLNFIRGKSGEGDDIVYDFFNYIARRNKGKILYYRLTGLKEGTSNTAMYERIEPLGYKNSFIEYEYGKEASEIKSVISTENKNIKDDSGFIPFDSDVTIPENPDFSDSSREASLFSDIANIALNYVYKDSSIETKDSKDITKIEPNTNYTDANNESICEIKF